jgi:iron(III) transport system substrate-binding protein
MRTLILTLASFAFLAGFGVAAQDKNDAVYRYKGADRDSRLLERARQEGSLVLYTSLAPTESGPLGQAFEKKTGVKVEIFRSISEKVVQRAITESRARRHAFDVIETNAPEMEMLAREKLFSAFHSPYLADLPAGTIPKHGEWVPDRVNFFVVAYNTNKVRRDELPSTYAGFLDAKWKGRIAVEATDAEWMATLVKLWGPAEGMAYFRKLADMKPDVRKGHVLLAELIAAGEIPVGLTAYHSNAESLKKRGAPIDWVPMKPVVGRPQGIAVARNGPHPHAALAFVDFVLSPEGQQILAGMGRAPVSTKVKTGLGQFDYTMVDPVTLLDEQDKWVKEWERLFLQK